MEWNDPYNGFENATDYKVMMCKYIIDHGFSSWAEWQASAGSPSCPAAVLKAISDLVMLPEQCQLSD